MPVFALVSIKKADYNSLIILLIFYPGTVAYKSALVPTKKKTIYSCPCSRTSFCQIFEGIQRFLIIHGKGKKHSSNTLIKRTHNGPKCFLACLDIKYLTVSQICNLTSRPSSTVTDFEAN